MSTTGRGGAAQSAMADREIVISRVIEAPESWCSRRSPRSGTCRWWGLEGFTTTMQVRVPRRSGSGTS